MRAGRLNKRVAIQAATTSRGTTGQPVQTWATAAVVWAAVEPVKADERAAHQGVQGAVSHRVVLRHNAFPTLTSKNRFAYGGRILEIRGVYNTREQNIEWVCDCVEIVT
jgi:SPP1 family predicted phage head-tail adaptor